MNTRYLFITALIFSSGPLLAQQATFEGLGGFPGVSAGTSAYGVSGDGMIVVGEGLTTDGDTEAFRWMEGGGLEALGDLSGGDFYSVAYDVSADGSVVVGNGTTNNTSFNEDEAFRWTETGGMASLGDLPGGDDFSRARGVSADGSVVVGEGTTDTSAEAFRWVDGSGMTGLGILTGGFSWAADVSADGAVVVGKSGSAAFRWTETGGMVDLGSLPGGGNMVPEAVSADGSTVVGYGKSSNTPGSFEWEAWRWTETGGVEGLDDFTDGDFHSRALGVSADGTVIVGWGTADLGNEAFIWTEAEGMRNLQEVLEDDYGLDLTGWFSLGAATGISDDGTVIVGYGLTSFGTEAWRAYLGTPVADEATLEELADVLTAPSPNPVHGTATFSVAVGQGQNVTVEVFDALGRRVRTLYNAPLSVGMSEALSLDVSALPAGVYVIRATGENFARIRRVTVVK